ncbi:MAG: hypothetical protein R3D85_17520 [Paracoccaceae bacterium]
MSGGHKSFDERVRLLERARSRAPRGHVQVAGPDGLVFAKKRRATPTVSARGVLYLIFGFILFKSIAMAQFGPAGYEQRLDELKQGTLIEQVGAVLMQPDRISAGLAIQIAPFLR